MSARRLVLVGGGPRSGKSAFALRRAEREGPRRLFVATARALDDELRARIDLHRAERDESWRTREEPLDLARALSEEHGCDVILIDCLTLWLSNLLVESRDDAAPARACTALLEMLARPGPPVVCVTNEVGLGLVPEHALGRAFRDHAGRLHRELAERADEVYLAILGCLLRLAPGPLERVSGGGA